MRCCRRGVVGLALPTGLLLLLLAPPAGAQNLLTNPDLAEGIQTRSVGQVLTAMQVPAENEDTILVFVRVTEGNAAIAGAVSIVDATTRDGSLIEMGRADF